SVRTSRRRPSPAWAPSDELEACLAMGYRVPRAERREAALARHRERNVARIAAWRIPWMTRVVDAHIIVGKETVREIVDVVACRELGRPSSRGHPAAPDARSGLPRPRAGGGGPGIAVTTSSPGGPVDETTRRRSSAG
ncbi:MAG TPA: hypothetical protein VML54_11280, partial [Candidatus Limnocylindrales bacterium]|nr:hypothetical protein [Candidatus Limnocylindrales bacterium]